MQSLSFVFRGNQIPIARILDLGVIDCISKEESDNLVLVFQTAREMIDKDRGEILPVWIFENIKDKVRKSDFDFALHVLKRLGVFKDGPFLIIDKASPYLKPVDNRNDSIINFILGHMRA